MTPLLLALPVAALGGLLWMHRSHLAAKAAKRNELQGTAEALSRALGMLSVGSEDCWELSGTVHGRATRIRITNKTHAVIAVGLGVGGLHAAHTSAFVRGGLDNTKYVASTHGALPAKWWHSGNVKALDRLPRGLRRWLEDHSSDSIDDGHLTLSRAIPDVANELRALQNALDV